MRYYTIQNNSILIADKEESLIRFYDNVLPLPEDYEEGKYIVIDGLLELDVEYEIKQEEKKQQEIAMFSLTAADVERGIYKATGKDFDDVIKEVESLKQVQGDNFNIDVKALKIELKANNFYRGNPYVDVVGALLGFTKEQLDAFFETNDCTNLLKVEE